MAVSGEEVGQFLMYLELVTTSKRIASPFEEAYQWLKETQTQLHPLETVGTIAFTSNGESKVNHLTWSDLNELHLSYQRLKNLEVLLNSHEIERVYAVRAVDNELS